MVMVLLIVSILIIIAFPFVLSMSSQEEGARSYESRTQANIGSSGAQNRAAQYLSATNPEQQWDRKEQNESFFNNPYADTPEDMNRALDDLLGTEFSTLLEDQNRRWGLHVEDEQGKLNINTTAEGILEKLRNRIPAGGRQSRHLTRYSGRLNQWGKPRGIRALDTITVEDRGTFEDQPIPESEAGLARGRRVLITDGYEQVTARYAGDGIFENLNIEPLSSDVRLWRMYIEIPHPVNMNTLSRPAMETLMEVLFPRLSRENREELIQLFQQEPLEDWTDFVDRLMDARRNDQLDTEQAGKLLGYSMGGGNALRMGDGYEEMISPAEKMEDRIPFPLLGFRNLGSFTVESRASNYTPADTPEGERIVRTIFSAGPGPGTSLVRQSQLEFVMGQRATDGILRNEQIATRPTNVGDYLSRLFSDMESGGTAPTDEEIQTDRIPGEGGVQPEPVNDERGNAVYETRRFQDTFDGRELSGEGISSGDFMPDPQPEPDDDYFGLDPGGVEFWVQFESVPEDVSFLDHAEASYINRIRLYFTSGELTLDVMDASLKEKMHRVQGDWSPRADTWYHIGAYWKGTKPGHLLLMVDGHVIGETEIIDSSGQNYLSRLTQSLPEVEREDDFDWNLEGLPIGEMAEVGTRTEGEIVLEDDVPLPEERGAVQIGDEIINYDQKEGNTLTGLERGARGSPIRQHPSSVRVEPFGYSSPLASAEFQNLATLDGIPATEGTLEDGFGEDPRTAVGYPEGSPRPPGRGGGGGRGEPQIIVTPEMDIIPATFEDADPEDFPEPGIIAVGSEMIMYETVENGGFTDTQRGVLGTVAQEHREGTPIVLFAFPVTSNEGYHEEASIVQLNEEWLAPIEPHDVGGHTFLGGAQIQESDVPIGTPIMGENAVLVPFLRGVLNTEHQEHEQNEKAIPCFLTSTPELSRISGLNNEEVTIVLEQGESQQRLEGEIRIGRGILGHSVAALDDFVEQEIETNEVNRILRFPSGELLSSSPGQPHFGAPAPEADVSSPGLSGKVDELRFFAGRRGDLRLTSALPEEESTVTTSFGRPGGGAIKVNDELIGLPTGEEIGENEDLSGFRVEDAERNYLDSEDETHAHGSRVFFLSFLAVTSLPEGVDEGEHQIPVRNRSGFDSDGHIRINDEIIGYTDSQGGEEDEAATLDQPLHTREQEGIYRGSFGTEPSSHEQNDMVFAMPVRYNDRAPRRNTYHPTMNTYYTSYHIPGARWRQLTWQIDNRDHNRLEMRFLVRAGMDSAWETTPSSAPETPFESRSAESSRMSFRASHPQLHVQALFGYDDNAYDPENWREQHSWKHTAFLTRLGVTFHQPLFRFESRRIR